MAVRIEMDIPKSCYECDLTQLLQEYNFGRKQFEAFNYCILLHKKAHKTKRLKKCPLKECE